MGVTKSCDFTKNKTFEWSRSGRGRSGQTVLAINLINIKIFPYKVTYNSEVGVTRLLNLFEI